MLQAASWQRVWSWQNSQSCVTRHGLRKIPHRVLEYLQAVATVGIFLPAFLLVAASGPLLPRIRRSKIAGAFLDGVNVGSLALMTEVTWQLGRTSLVDVVTMVLAVVSVVALLRLRLNSAWLMLIGAVVGLMTRAVHHSL